MLDLMSFCNKSFLGLWYWYKVHLCSQTLTNFDFVRSHFWCYLNYFCMHMCMFITDSSRYEITPPTTESRNTCLSVDGQLHEDGDSWHDGCRLCYCYGGQEMCALISCPRPYCSIPVFRLGDCCPSCPGEQYCLFLKVNQDLYSTSLYSSHL